ncbi:hypothetical protein G7Z17_g259 [Cylindrodendrum hubeiense]|uniref:Uncharacterized protein n=1 Tax=Cylindrodendrum hubeiense TaxID=595255 RepID=A0A9P5HQ11_9HYPO|nr:hypothetical protein G7Z17_g259 [Cylindrodendrum hubeiense]
MERVFRLMPSSLLGQYLHAPDAKLSSESPIQFNVADAMGQDVFDLKPKRTFVHFDGAHDSQAPATPSDDREEDKKTITADWASQAEMAASVMDAWTKVESFKLWDLRQFDVRVPKKTINKFDEMYMTMPALTVA